MSPLAQTCGFIARRAMNGAPLQGSGAGHRPLHRGDCGGADAGRGSERSFPGGVERSLAGASHGERRCERPSREGTELSLCPPLARATARSSRRRGCERSFSGRKGERRRAGSSHVERRSEDPLQGSGVGHRPPHGGDCGGADAGRKPACPGGALPLHGQDRRPELLELRRVRHRELHPLSREGVDKPQMERMEQKTGNRDG